MGIEIKFRDKVTKLLKPYQADYHVSTDGSVIEVFSDECGDGTMSDYIRDMDDIEAVAFHNGIVLGVVSP